MLVSDMTNNRDWLFHIEALNIGATLNDTGQISVRRGASMAMREAVQKLPRFLAEQEASINKISTGGSKLIFSTTLNGPNENEEEEKRLKAKIIEFLRGNEDLSGDNLLKAVLPQLSFSVSAVACTDRPEAEQRQTLLATNRFQQMRLPSIYLGDLEGAEVEEPPNCYLEGKRPADPKCHITVGKEKKKISRSVNNRYQYGKNQKASFIKRELDLPDSPDVIDLKFVPDLEQLSGIKDKPLNGNKEDSNKENSELPENIKGLRGKIAVLYFDGNRMGKKQDAMTNSELIRFDKALDDARRKFLVETMALYKKNPEALQSPENKWRLEILLWGGDEILLVVPAWAGFAVLYAFYQAMSEFKNNHGISHAGGLIFCKHDTPIQRLAPLAQELAETAKMFSRSNDYYFPLLLESEGYPVRRMMDYWTAHYKEAGRILMPLSPWSDSGSLDRVLKIKKTRRRSAIRKHAVGMFEVFHKPGAFDSQCEVLNQWLEDEELNSLGKDIGTLFPLMPVDALSDTDMSAVKLEPYRQGHGRLSRLLPWMMLVEYWDYLIDLKGTAT